MKLLVNGEALERVEGSSIRDLVLSLDINPEAVAVALNGEVVPRRRHAEALLRDGDRLEIVRAVGGG